MTGSDLNTLLTQLMDGREQDQTLVVTLFNLAKDWVENQRPWVVLRKVDSSKIVAVSDGITNTKALPTDFRKPFTVKRPDGRRSAIVLKTGTSVRYVNEIPFGTQYEKADDADLFFIDHSSNVFAFTGIRDQQYTVYLNYIKKSTNFTSALTETWAFPSEYHPIIAFLSAQIIKSGIDYDDISIQQALGNSQQARLIIGSMNLWNDSLMRSSLGI
jgi:hypothetical protein